MQQHEQTFPLSELPEELILMIIERLTPSALFAFSATHRHARYDLIPRLLEKLIVTHQKDTIAHSPTFGQIINIPTEKNTLWKIKPPRLTEKQLRNMSSRNIYEEALRQYKYGKTIRSLFIEDGDDGNYPPDKLTYMMLLGHFSTQDYHAPLSEAKSIGFILSRIYNQLEISDILSRAITHRRIGSKAQIFDDFVDLCGPNTPTSIRFARIILARRTIGTMLPRFGAPVREDREAVKAATMNNPLALEHAAKTLRQDPALCLALAKAGKLRMKFTLNPVRANKKIILALLKAHADNGLIRTRAQTALVVKEMDPSLRKDIDFLINIIKVNYHVIAGFTKTALKNPRIITAGVMQICKVINSELEKSQYSYYRYVLHSTDDNRNHTPHALLNKLLSRDDILNDALTQKLLQSVKDRGWVYAHEFLTAWFKCPEAGQCVKPPFKDLTAELAKSKMFEFNVYTSSNFFQTGKTYMSVKHRSLALHQQPVPASTLLASLTFGTGSSPLEPVGRSTNLPPMDLLSLQPAPASTSESDPVFYPSLWEEFDQGPVAGSAGPAIATPETQGVATADFTVSEAGPADMTSVKLLSPRKRDGVPLQSGTLKSLKANPASHECNHYSPYSTAAFNRRRFAFMQEQTVETDSEGGAADTIDMQRTS